MIRLATDVGGTFTDLVGYDEATGQLFQAKALTTVHDQSGGVLDTIAVARQQGMSPAQVAFFAHGGTTVINAITERKGVKTALVTTAGFRDVLEIGRGNRPDLYNLRFRSPEPFVPRHLRFELRERLDATGAIVQPLALDGLEAIAAACRTEGVEAVGIIFLHSYANPVHEQQAARALAVLLPDVTICASHEISREWREYERSNTVALNAYVQPIIRRYFARLETALAAGGIDCPYYAMQSNGGIATIVQGTERPLTLVESGPAGGVAGAAHIGAALDQADVLYLDVGGTTAKCSLIRDGRPKLDTAYKLEHTRISPGYPVQVPVVDIVEIGAGGGSIAWVDSGGMLAVGPKSAGAEPGPACYGRGGSKPTVTDAQYLLGYLDPSLFEAGEIDFDRDASWRAVKENVADPLKLDVIAAAAGIYDIVNSNMAAALGVVSVQRGYDPREFVLVVAGGAGPIHAAPIARELQIPLILIPRASSVFCAAGMLISDLKHDFVRTYAREFSQVKPAEVRKLYAEMAAAGKATLKTEHVPASRIEIDYTADVRYVGQFNEVEVPVPGNGRIDAAALEAIAEEFHNRHDGLYGYSMRGAALELINLRITARGRTDKPKQEKLRRKGSGSAHARIGKRKAFFDGRFLDVSVYDGLALQAGNRVPGPAIVVQPTTSIVVPPDFDFLCDDYGNYLMFGKGQDVAKLCKSLR